jgi:hypothetical protein
MVFIESTRISIFYSMVTRVADPHQPLMRIRILFLIKVMGICDHWSKDPLSSVVEP